MNLTKATDLKSNSPRARWLNTSSILKRGFAGVCLVASCGLGQLGWAASPPVAPVGAAYPPPTDGWTYIYDGDKDTAGADGSGFASLDGTWSHDNGSDEW